MTDDDVYIAWNIEPRAFTRALDEGEMTQNQSITLQIFMRKMHVWG